jgi:hypothetical protein
MSGLKIWGILRSILPTSKIGAWILGLLGAALAMILGVSSGDLKDKFCAAPPVELPNFEVKTEAAAPKTEVKK